MNTCPGSPLPLQGFLREYTVGSHWHTHTDVVFDLPQWFVDWGQSVCLNSVTFGSPESTSNSGKERGDIEIKDYIFLQKTQAQDNRLPPLVPLSWISRWHMLGLGVYICTFQCGEYKGLWETDQWFEWSETDNKSKHSCNRPNHDTSTQTRVTCRVPYSEHCVFSTHCTWVGVD